MHCTRPHTGCSTSPGGCSRYGAFTVKPWVYAGLDPRTLANSYLAEYCNNKVEFGVTGRQGSGMLAQVDSQALLSYDNLTGPGSFTDVSEAIGNIVPVVVRVCALSSCVLCCLGPRGSALLHMHVCCAPDGYDGDRQHRSRAHSHDGGEPLAAGDLGDSQLTPVRECVPSPSCLAGGVVLCAAAGPLIPRDRPYCHARVVPVESWATIRAT